MMNLLVNDPRKPEHAEEVSNALIELIEANLDVKRFNFYLSFTKFANLTNIEVIYDSEWCRISFMFSREIFPERDELTIQYGRLHAPNEKPFMIWQGEECNCWHRILAPLRFLDGLSPVEAVQQVMVQKELPPVVENFRQTKHGKKLLSEYPPKYGIALHSVLWEHYGQRLFELFDLRRPDLWEEYRQFIREYHRLLGTKTNYGPPEENIC